MVYFNDYTNKVYYSKGTVSFAGLAPGLQGANRTGRPFTGDWAGDLLYETLLKLGLAKGKKHHDKRQDLKERSARREMDVALKRKRTRK